MLTKYSYIGWLELAYICMDLTVIWMCLSRLSYMSHMKNNFKIVLRRVGLLCLLGSCTAYVASYFTMSNSTIEAIRQFSFIFGVFALLVSTQHRYSDKNHPILGVKQ